MARRLTDVVFRRTGGLPDLVNVPKGCIFAERCPSRFDKCAEEPSLRGVAPDHNAACWLVR